MNMEEELEKEEGVATMTEMSPDESAASLSFATMLSEGLMPQETEDMALEGQQEPAPEEAMPGEMAPAQPEPAEAPVEPIEEEPEEDKFETMETSLSSKLADFRDEVKDTIKNEMEGIKKALKDALLE